MNHLILFSILAAANQALSQPTLSDTPGMHYHHYKERGGIHQVELDPSHIDVKVAHSSDWHEPKTVQQFVRDYDSLGGINGGFWRFEDGTGLFGYYLNKIKERIGSQTATLPLALLKTPQGVVSSVSDFWAAIGWQNTEPSKIKVGYLGIDWVTKLNGKKINLKYTSYNFISSEKTIFFPSLLKNEKKIYKLIVKDNIIQDVVEVPSIDSFSGTFISSEPLEFIPSRGEKLPIEPFYAIPFKGQHAIRDLTETEEWAAMDYVISGKFLIHDGASKLEDLRHDFDYGKYQKKDSKTAACVTRKRQWIFFVAAAISARDLIAHAEASGCHNALLLDGGSSSTLILRDDKAQLLDITSNFTRAQTRGKMRALSDAIIFERKKGCQNLTDNKNNEYKAD